MWLGVSLSGLDDEFEFFMFITVNIWTVYCGSYDIKKTIFKALGIRYNGVIAKAERMCGNGKDTYYLFIEFYKNKKKLIRRTSGYLGSPNQYLRNKNCHVYEFLGMFIENDFNIRTKFPDSIDDYLDIKTEPHKMFMPKGDKYV